VSYAVKEIFLTLQGEGIHAGRPAVFLRFSGCNLWNGLPSGRARGSGSCALWCDTDFVGTDGQGGGRFETALDLAHAVRSLWPHKGPGFVVCTGGEPALQLDEELIAALHNAGFMIAIETNGTRPLPKGIDWICVSPKVGSSLAVQSGHELKLVFPQDGLAPQTFEHLAFDHFLLQPLDNAHHSENTQAAISHCLRHPRWRLSVQTHKVLGIP